MEICRPNVWVKCRAVRHVHLRTKIRSNKMLRETGHEVEWPGTVGVVRERQSIHHIGEPGWQKVGEIVAGRPVFQLQDPRTSEAVAEPRSDALESRPEFPHRISEQDHAVAAVDQLGRASAELRQEGVWVPEGGIEAVNAAADDDWSTATPLTPPQHHRRRTPMIKKLQ